MSWTALTSCSPRIFTWFTHSILTPPVRNKITHLYSLGTPWLFSEYTLSKPSWILFLLTIKIFNDDQNLLANVTFPYRTLILVSRDQKFVTSLVQSAIISYFIFWIHSRSLCWGERSVWLGQDFFPNLSLWSSSFLYLFVVYVRSRP